MNGKLVAVSAVHTDFINTSVVVETYEPATFELLDDIRHVSTKRIERSNSGQPATPQDEWGIEPFEVFTEMGGFLKRSPEGTLSFILPLGNGAEFIRPADFVFFSCEEVPA